MMMKPKVFCVGFQKTGTTSLYAALTDLGYKTAAVIGRDLSAEELRFRGASLCIETAKDFDAVQDMPWPLFFRELDNAYPGAKFILTEREANAWFASIEKHFGSEPDAMQEFIYGNDTPYPAGNKDRYQQVYRDHNQAVRTYFVNRPSDLLIMDLANGDGWDTLCTFLGCPCPTKPFPMKNQARDREALGYKIRRKITRLLGGYLAPEKI